MPFPTLASLPDNIKKLSRKKQSQWRQIWNSVFAKTKDEGRAFAAANAIINKEAVDMKKLKTIELGVVDLSEAMAEVKEDKENGILKDVVLLTGGRPTKNNTLYSQTALVEAVGRYRGAKMFLDHGEDPVRSVRDFGGVYKNVHLDVSGTKVMADLHVAEGVKDLAFSMARLGAGGLSISDRGKGHEDGDTFIIEKFSGTGPFSIDLVSEPSANVNIFESLKDDEEEKNKGGSDMEISKVTLEQLTEGNPKLVESIQNETKKAVMKEVEEKLKKGENADKIFALGTKLSVLAEAGFPAEVSKSVRKMIERDDVTVEGAKVLIEAQGEVIKTISVKPAGNPKVKGAGADHDLGEDDKGKPKEVTSQLIREALVA